MTGKILSIALNPDHPGLLDIEFEMAVSRFTNEPQVIGMTVNADGGFVPTLRRAHLERRQVVIQMAVSNVILAD